MNKPSAWLSIVVGAVLSMIVVVSHATIDVYEFNNTRQEEDFRILVQELRCPKCQNQNIADSNAGLAKDIKDRAYKLLREGKSRDEITDYMVERYGEFITYRPPVTKSTWILWFGPFVLLALVVVVLVVRKRASVKTDQKAEQEKGVTQENVTTNNQKQRVDALLQQYGPDDDQQRG